MIWFSLAHCPIIPYHGPSLALANALPLFPQLWVNHSIKGLRWTSLFISLTSSCTSHVTSSALNGIPTKHLLVLHEPRYLICSDSGIPTNPLASSCKSHITSISKKRFSAEVETATFLLPSIFYIE